MNGVTITYLMAIISQATIIAYIVGKYDGVVFASSLASEGFSAWEQDMKKFFQ